jgi:hypothetical protein
VSGAGASAESDFRDDAPNGRVETVAAKAEIAGVKAEIAGVKAEIAGAKAEIAGVKAAEAVAAKAEIAGVKAEAVREALTRARGSEASKRAASVVHVEARALVTHTSARNPETRSSGAVDALVNDGCTPA